MLSRLPPPLLFLAAGGILAVLSWLDVFPALYLAVHLSPDAQISPALALLLTRSQWLLALCLILATPLLAPLVSLLHQARDGLCRPNCVACVLLLLGLCAFTLALLSQTLLFQGMPHVTDAVSHSFQAKILAHGHLSAPVPPCYEFFFADNIYMSPSGKWHTKYFPGQALWLSGGEILHAPWLPMPLGLAITVVLIAWIGYRLAGPVWGYLAGLLFACSPLSLLLAGSFMSHTTFVMLAAVSLALWMFGDDLSTWRKRCAWVASGAAAGLAAITRPQDFLAVGLVVCPLALYLHFSRHGRLPKPALFCAGGMFALAILVVWNLKIYGAIFATGYNFSHSPSLTPIKSDAIGFSTEHTPRDALTYMMWTWLRFNKAFLGWPSSLIFVPFAFCAARWRRVALVCAACVASITMAYAFFPYYGFEYEARYYYAASPFVLVLSLLGLRVVYSCLLAFFSRRHEPETAQRRALQIAAGLVAVGLLHAAFYYWPLYVGPQYARDYEQASPVVHQSALRAGLDRALVLVPSEGSGNFRYSSAFPFNDPWLSNPVIYARDLGGTYACLKEHFSDRVLYRFVPDEDWERGRLERVDTRTP